MSSDRELGLVWGLVALACVALSPWASRFAESLPGCPLKSLAGLPCPTCGAGRATLALAALDPLAALAANPLVTLGWTALIVGGLLALLWTGSGRPLLSLPTQLPIALRLGAVGVVLANWVYLIRAGI